MSLNRSQTTRAVAVLVTAGLVLGPGPRAVVAQTAPRIYYACYVPLTGTVYRIKESTLKTTCTTGHIEFSWSDGSDAVKVTDALGGDLSGVFSSANVVKLLGRALSTIVPTPGQVLGWDGSAWSPTTIAAATLPPAGGDLSGSLGNATVVRLQGRSVSATQPGVGQLLEWNGTSWAPGNRPLNGGGDLVGPLTQATVVGLEGRPVSATAPQDGQVLTWNGLVQVWAPTTPAVPAHAQLPGLIGDDHPQYLLANGVRNAPNGFAVTGSVFGGSVPVTGAGTRLMWYPHQAAFRAGQVSGTAWDPANVGLWSTAIGRDATASGDGSTAIGSGAQATGPNAAAFGTAKATGFRSTASGNSTASGAGSMAVGEGNTASGDFSVALGEDAIASGDHSFALGLAASTFNWHGTFVYADASSTTPVKASTHHQFTVRASGGFRLRTATDLSTGCDLPPGSGTWSCTSSRFAKEGFTDLSGDDVLSKIGAMSIQRWSYRADSSRALHVGPTAQDFRAAFGLGNSDEAISLVDIDGINMLGVQALVRRTKALQDENADLRARLERLEAAIRRLENR
jgi:hypothetical protein